MSVSSQATKNAYSWPNPSISGTADAQCAKGLHFSAFHLEVSSMGWGLLWKGAPIVEPFFLGFSLFVVHSSKKTPIVTKRVDDFRERTQPQLGQVHDP